MVQLGEAAGEYKHRHLSFVEKTGGEHDEVNALMHSDGEGFA